MSYDVDYSDADRLKIMLNALKHYKLRLEEAIENKDNKKVKDILQKYIQSKLELIEEMMPYYEKNDLQHITEQWDRYQHPLCLSLRAYADDLEKSIHIIKTSFLNYSPNMKNIEDELRNCKRVSEISCEQHFQKIDGKLTFPNF